MKIKLPLVVLLCCAINSLAQVGERQQFIRTEAPVIALTHVRVIDGTGSAPKEDQTIVISGGKIQSIEPSAAAKIPANAQTLELNGYTVLPGLVGMHNHMFFPMGGRLSCSSRRDSHQLKPYRSQHSTVRSFLVKMRASDRSPRGNRQT